MSEVPEVTEEAPIEDASAAIGGPMIHEPIVPTPLAGSSGPTDVIPGVNAVHPDERDAEPEQVEEESDPDPEEAGEGEEADADDEGEEADETDEFDA